MPKAPLSGELSPQATERFSYYDCLLHPSPAGGQNLTEQVDNIMREIQIAQNKTLKLTNVVSRRIQPEEFNNMQIVLTQMHNFIKSNGAQPLGPLVQCIKLPAGPNPQPEVYMMQQATQLIPRMEAGYSMDAVLRVRNCLYAHYVGPMSQSGLASQKLNIMAFEHELELTGTVYTIFVNQDDDEGVVDTFMETK